MSEDLATALGPPRMRFDRVEAAYDALKDEDKNVFREAINNPDYSHVQLAEALRYMGYDVDRKQVQAFREKLKLGKVKL